MVRCCIPGCSSTAKANTETLRPNEESHDKHLFRFPKDPRRFDLWCQAIPYYSECQKSAVLAVCDLHFAEQFIIRNYEIRVGDDIVTIPRQRLQLHPDAVPSIFPDAGQQTVPFKHSMRQKELLKRSSATTAVDAPVKKKRKDDILGEATTTQIPSSNIDNPTGTGKEKDISLFDDQATVVDEEVIFSQNEMTNCIKYNFEDVVNEQKQICVPHIGWVCLSNSQFVCFAKSAIEQGKIRLTASITVSQDMYASCYYNGVEVPNLCRLIQSASDLQALISRLEGMIICCGNNDTNLRTVIGKSNIGFYDEINQCWRSAQCAVLVDKDAFGRCLPCKQMRHVLKSAAGRVNRQIPRRNCTSFMNSSVKRNVQKIRRLQKSISTFKALANHLQLEMKRKGADVIDDACKDLPPLQKLAVRHCIQDARKKSKNGMRYDSQWILSCILLRIKSAATYEHMRNNKLLPLPSRSTLGRYISVVKAECGFHEEVLKVLEGKVKTDTERHGILSFDEIKLRSQLSFNKQAMDVAGFVDFGEFTTEQQKTEIADHALVYLFRPVLGGWVQTVGMYLSKGAAPGPILAKLLLKCILALEAHGLKVDGVVCDGSKPNRKMWHEFGLHGSWFCKGVSLEMVLRNSIVHPVSTCTSGDEVERRLYFFSDYVHLFKCMRNNLLKRKEFQVNGESVKWRHFQALFNLEEQNEGLRVAPKLTYAHIHPTPFERMNVRLAVQLFSNTTADALQFYLDRHVPSLQDCEPTIAFCRRVNRLFDTLNSKLPMEGLRLNSDSLQFLKEISKWLMDWEESTTLFYWENKELKIDRSKGLSLETFHGMHVTIKSTIELSEYLLSTTEMSYILTSRFSQDPLERFFGMARHAGGCDDHPTILTFLFIYRLLSVYGLIHIPRQKMNIENVVDETACSTLIPSTSSSTSSNRARITAEFATRLRSYSVSELVPEDITDILPPGRHNERDDVSQNIVFYLSGYVLRKCRTFTECVHCLASLKGDISDDTVPIARLYNIKNRGGLLLPSHVLLTYLLDLEKSITAALKTSVLTAFPQILDEAVPASLALRNVLCEDHGTSLISDITVFYVTTRFHWHTMFLNRQNSADQRVKNTRKKCKVL